MLRLWRTRGDIVMHQERSGPDSAPPLMDYDAELRLLNEVLRRAYGIQRLTTSWISDAEQGRRRVRRHAWPPKVELWG